VNGLDNIPLATPEGYFISAEHKRIAEIVNDYDQDLYLLFIPPARREPGDHPYAVMHQPEGKAPYIAAYFDECDERILEHLFLNDTRRHDMMAKIEAQELAQQLVDAKRREDIAAEKADMAKSMWRSPLHSYKHNGKKLDL
jgi:hypothetical protein